MGGDCSAGFLDADRIDGIVTRTVSFCFSLSACLSHVD